MITGFYRLTRFLKLYFLSIITDAIREVKINFQKKRKGSAKLHFLSYF
jgi:hypothetical protein